MTEETILAKICLKGTNTVKSSRSGSGNLFTTTGRMNCALSLAGCKIH